MLHAPISPFPIGRSTLTQLWRHAQELFDSYLLACFILFSGVTLEALAWEVRRRRRACGMKKCECCASHAVAMPPPKHSCTKDLR